MGLNNVIRKNQKALATTAIVGGAGTTVALNSLSMVAEDVQVGSLSVNIVATATTNLLTLTGKWQVSADASTWVDAFTENNATNVTLVTGTGAPVSTTRCVAAPSCAYGKSYARYAFLTGAAAAGAGDEYSGSYNYRKGARY